MVEISNTSIKPKSKIVWIDVIRVVAMLLVVIEHGTYTGGYTKFGSFGFANEHEASNFVNQLFSNSILRLFL